MNACRPHFRSTGICGVRRSWNGEGKLKLRTRNESCAVVYVTQLRGLDTRFVGLDYSIESHFTIGLQQGRIHRPRHPMPTSPSRGKPTLRSSSDLPTPYNSLVCSSHKISSSSSPSWFSSFLASASNLLHMCCHW